jgi:hypothetical protein
MDYHAIIHPYLQSKIAVGDNKYNIIYEFFIKQFLTWDSTKTDLDNLTSDGEKEPFIKKYIDLAINKYDELVKEYKVINVPITEGIFRLSIMDYNDFKKYKLETNKEYKLCTFPEDQKANFTQVPINGDGNCLFHCLTHLKYWKGKTHVYIRQEICTKLDEIIDTLKITMMDETPLLSFITDDIKTDETYTQSKEKYIEQMKKEDEGTMLEIIAAQIITGKNICVYMIYNQKFSKDWYEQIKNKLNDVYTNIKYSQDCDLILHACKLPNGARHYEVLILTEEAVKKQAEEDAVKKKAEEDAVKKKAEEAAATKKAEEAAAKKQAEEAAAKKQAEEAAAKKQAEEDAAAAVKKQSEEATAKKQAKEEGVTAVKPLVISDKVDKECRLPPNLEEYYTITDSPADGNSLFECLKLSCENKCSLWPTPLIDTLRADISKWIPYVVDRFNGIRTGPLLNGIAAEGSLTLETMEFINKHYSNIILEGKQIEAHKENMEKDKYYGSIIEILIAQILMKRNIILYDKTGIIDGYEKLKNSFFTDSYNKEKNTFDKVRLYLCNYDDTNKKNIHYQLMMPTEKGAAKEKAEEEKRIETAEVIRQINELSRQCHP